MTEFFAAISGKLTKLAVTFLIGVAAAQSAFAETTSLTFDDILDGITITSQYQGIGVLVSGAVALDALHTPWPANSSPNVAYAPTGLMTFTVNSTITGDIQSVSAYISGDTSVGIYAYDSGGALVGQAVTGGASNNQLVSVTSSGGPIASIQIHDGGSSFAIDTLDFVSTPPPPPPPPPPTILELVDLYYNAVVALTANDFVNTQHYQGKEKLMLHDIRHLKKLLARGDARSSRILQQIKTMKKHVDRFLTATTPAEAGLLSLLAQIEALVPLDGSDGSSGSKDRDCHK
jgi:hypothetical protein